MSGEKLGLQRQGQRVEVRWVDASFTSEADRPAAPCYKHTMGYVAAHEARGIWVNHERWSEDGEWSFQGQTFIPAGCIVTVEPLERPEAAKGEDAPLPPK